MFTETSKYVKKTNESVLQKTIQFICNEQEDLIWILLDKSEKLMAYSPSARIFFKQNIAIEVGQNIASLLNEDVYEKLLLKEIKDESKRTNIELLLEGNSLHFEMKRKKMITQDQHYYTIILKDITYTKLLEQKMYDHEKTVQSALFAMGMVHEFRNPLTSIRGFLQLLQAGVKQEVAYYQVMINEVDKLEKIAGNLLQLSKPYESQKAHESIASLVEDVIFLFQTQVNMKNLLFKLDIQENLTCFCNAVQIKQVFLNLIKNAAEAIDYDGLIKINAHTNFNQEEIIIDIIDNGEGVSEEMVFDMITPFYTTKKEGTGLGLAISHSLLDEHGGSLKIQKHKESGTIARMMLPNIGA